MSRTPTLFVSHGAPTLATDRLRGGRLRQWGASLPRPRAVLIVSAHWEATPTLLGAVRRLPLLHDYAGFPAELQRLRYDAPPAPALADDVRALLGASVAEAPDRPWDHGVWVPLLHMLPDATTPVLQLSLPSGAGLKGAFDLGHALAPLRDEGVLILGSGGAVHNLGRLDWRGAGPPPPWAVEFEDWLRAAVAARDVDALLDARRRAPGLALAHPTLEHFLPLLVALGAASSAPAEPVTFPVEGWEFGSLSHLGVQFG